MLRLLNLIRNPCQKSVYSATKAVKWSENILIAYVLVSLTLAETGECSLICSGREFQKALVSKCVPSV